MMEESKHISDNVNRLEDVDNLHEFREEEGYVLDVGALSNDQHLKLAGDNHTILIPQPSDDPLDPLNWSSARKHVTLFIISATALLPDYGSGAGAVTLLQQAKDWGLSPDTVNHASVGNVFMLGAGGLFAVSFAAYFGRLPVAFWFMVAAFATAAWCAGATTFESFMAARILNGFFSTVMQAGGLILINEMFFFHERVRKINIWTSFIVLSPYLGPLLTAFIITTQTWNWPFWVYTIMTFLCLAAVVLFVDETYYDRKVPTEAQPPRHSRWMRLIGVEQRRTHLLRNTFYQAVMRLMRVVLKPVVPITCLSYLLILAWAVGINTTLSIFLTSLFKFGPKQIGFFYFTPIVAGLLGEIIGHWLHDVLAAQYIQRHAGHFEPEVRLRAVFVAAPFMIGGLILLGFCFEENYHFMVAAVGWGSYIFGYMITTVALNAYLLDSYPEASGEVAAWINFARTTGGFIVSYFQVSWAASMGTKRTFGIQAAICFFAVLLIVSLIAFGKGLRIWSGSLHFKTN